MNKSKIVTASAIATVMSATAATAEISIYGFAAGYWSTASDATGSSIGRKSETLGLSYSGTMDNGMGVGVTIIRANFGTGDTNPSGSSSDTQNVKINVSSDMGTLHFGSNMDSAADGMDGMPGKAGLGLSGTDIAIAKDYSDGDSATGHGIKYESPSISGWNVAVSTGFSDTQGIDATTSFAVKGSIAGISLAAGVASIDAADTAAVESADAIAGYYTINTAIDTPIAISTGGTTTGANSVAGAAELVAAGTHTIGQAFTPAVEAAAAVEGSHDDTFMTASYSLGDISLGYGLYTSDATGGDSATSISVSMPLAGMTAGIQYSEADNSGAEADDDGYRIGLVKPMGGGATFSVEYTDVSYGDTAVEDSTGLRIGYMMSF
jgi:hypothetical protein